MSARTDMPSAFFRAVERHGLLAADDAVLAAVSGGGDSVALLHLLTALSRRIPLRLTVAHVNHRLRGADSDADAAFVEDLALRLGWPCRTLETDPPVEASSRPVPEEGLRRARRRILLHLARDAGCTRIALGHTMDDQAETVLMRLMRGTGRRGLAGMARATPDGVVRPLLGFRREALRRWLAACGETWREDASNDDLRYLRNRVRSVVLPSLIACNPAVVRTLSRGADLMGEEDRLLDAMAAEAIDPVVREAGRGVAVPAASIRALPDPIARRAARRMIRRAGGDPRGAGSASVAHVLRIARGGSLARHGLAGGLQAERRGDDVHIGPREGTIGRPSPFSLTMTIPGEATIPTTGAVLSARLMPERAALPPMGDAARACLDADRLGSVVTIRNRRPGDRFHPLGGPGPRRLKEFLIDGKVPRSERDRIPLVEGPDGIAWVVGQRIGDPYRLTGATRRVVVLECSRVDLAEPPL